MAMSSEFLEAMQQAIQDGDEKLLLAIQQLYVQFIQHKSAGIVTEQMPLLEQKTESEKKEEEIPQQYIHMATVMLSTAKTYKLRDGREVLSRFSIYDVMNQKGENEKKRFISALVRDFDTDRYTYQELDPSQDLSGLKKNQKFLLRADAEKILAQVIKLGLAQKRM